MLFYPYFIYVLSYPSSTLFLFHIQMFISYLAFIKSGSLKFMEMVIKLVDNRWKKIHILVDMIGPNYLLLSLIPPKS